MPIFRPVTPILLILCLILMGQISIQDAQDGDLVLLSEAALQSRTSGNFRSDSDNKDLILPKGTWGKIKAKKLFNSGNYGIKIEVDSGSSKKDVWVYYQKTAPHNGILLYNQAQAAQLRGVASPATSRSTSPEMADYVYTNKKGIKGHTFGEGGGEVGNLIANSSYKVDKERYERYQNSLPEGEVGNWIPLNMKSDGSTIWVRFQDVALSPAIIGQVKNTLLPIGEFCEARPAPTNVVAPRTPLSNNLTYEACNSSNDYLEQGLSRAVQATRESLSNFNFSQDYLSSLRSCVQQSLKIGQEGGYIKGADCPSDSTYLADTRNRNFHCASKNAVETLSHELAMAAKCADVDPKELIALYNHESRFRIDARSPTDAMGPAQITRGAVIDLGEMFDGEAYPKFLRHLRDQGSKCDYIKNLGAISEEKTSFNCARSSLPENPRRNIFYGAFYYKRIRDWGPKSAQAWVNKLLDAEKIKPADKEKWVREIVRAMYNGGPGQISSIAEAFLDDDQTLAGRSFQMGMAEWREAISEENSEAGAYARKITTDSALLNERTNKSCAIAI